MGNSVGSARSVYAPGSLWARIEKAMQEYEAKTKRRFRGFSSFIVIVLEKGLERLAEENRS